MILTNRREALLDMIYFIISTHPDISYEKLKDKFERELTYFEIDDINLDNILKTLIKDELILFSNDKYKANIIVGDEIAGGYLTKKYIAKNKTNKEQAKDIILKLIPIVLTCFSVTFAILTYMSNIKVDQLTKVNKDLSDRVQIQGNIIAELKLKLNKH